MNLQAKIESTENWKTWNNISISPSIQKILNNALKHIFLPLFCFGVLFCITGCSNEETVSEFSSRIETQMNKELSNPNHSIRRRVENAHVTVDATSAYISNIRIITKDGSNNAGESGSNVKEIHANIVVKWDGIFDKDGYTEFSAVWDIVSGKPILKAAKFEKSTAIVNIEDPNFWFDVAGALIFIVTL